jgi:hypothetical protein
MTKVSDTALESGITLGTMFVVEPEITDIPNEARYQTLRMVITLKGRTADIYEFLVRLNREVPVVGVTSIRIGGLDKSDLTPTAEVVLLFYLSPEPVPTG